MRLLADESFDARITSALRDAGHDVLSILETAPGISDDEVLARADSDQRVVLTEDKDLRQARSQLAETIVEFFRQDQTVHRGDVAVITPGQVRIQRSSA